jgi:hypothetical protein
MKVELSEISNCEEYYPSGVVIVEKWVVVDKN